MSEENIIVTGSDLVSEETNSAQSDCKEEIVSTTDYHPVEAQEPVAKEEDQNQEENPCAETQTSVIEIEIDASKWHLKHSVLSFIFHQITPFIVGLYRWLKARFYYYTTPSWVPTDRKTMTPADKFFKMCRCEVKSGYRLDPIRCTPKQRHNEMMKHIHRHLDGPITKFKRRFYEWKKKVKERQ
jgi:hypothetical protein